jgi:hypothetical protein
MAGADVVDAYRSAPVDVVAEIIDGGALHDASPGAADRRVS